jgi:hypothetical protein
MPICKGARIQKVKRLQQEEEEKITTARGKRRK